MPHVTTRFAPVNFMVKKKKEESESETSGFDLDIVPSSHLRRSSHIVRRKGEKEGKKEKRGKKGTEEDLQVAFRRNRPLARRRKKKEKKKKERERHGWAVCAVCLPNPEKKKGEKRGKSREAGELLFFPYFPRPPKSKSGGKMRMWSKHVISRPRKRGKRGEEGG